MSWKGLLLAGGTGSRLYPVTGSVNKHLLPVFDKPMIYYPLTTLMLAGIREIVVISTPAGVDQIRALLGNGDAYGLALTYVLQSTPGGVAEGLVLAEHELEGHNVAMMLGDNILIGSGLEPALLAATRKNRGATAFSYEVANPSAFGIVTMKNGKPVEIVEKPAKSKSRTALIGLYFYDKSVLGIAKSLKPSARGELEITDVNRAYLERGTLDVLELGRGMAWLDGGTPEDLYEASQFVHVVQKRTGLKIAVPEEVAYRRGFIEKRQLEQIIAGLSPSDYRDYLANVLDENADEAGQLHFGQISDALTAHRIRR
jgi:glucose-1-phosphate thymidylyltransferase